MNWILLLQLLPLIISLLKIAESLFGSGTGIKKKDFVVEGIELITKATPGAQKESWKAINNAMPDIKILIDILAGIFFSKKK